MEFHPCECTGYVQERHKFSTAIARIRDTAMLRPLHCHQMEAEPSPYLDVIRIRLFAFVTGGMTHQEGCVQKHLPGQALVRRRKIGRSHQRYDRDALKTEEALITEVMWCPRPTHNDVVFEAGNVLPMGITIMPDFNGVLLYAAERSQHAKNKYPGQYYHQCRFQFLVDLKY